MKQTDEELVKSLYKAAYRLSMINAADRGWDAKAAAAASGDLNELRRACDERGVTYDLSGYLV